MLHFYILFSLKSKYENKTIMLVLLWPRSTSPYFATDELFCVAITKYEKITFVT